MRLYVPIILSAASLAALSSAQMSLSANQTVAVPNMGYGPFNILAQMTSPFTGRDVNGNVVFTGSLTSRVDQRVGQSTLDFQFILTNDATSTDPIEKLTLSGYQAFVTSVLQTQIATEPLVTNAGRTSSGVVSFNYLSGAGNGGLLNPGTTSTYLTVETNATRFTSGTASVIDGGVGAVGTYMPTPEPSALAAIGVGALGLLRRRAKRA